MELRSNIQTGALGLCLHPLPRRTHLAFCVASEEIQNRDRFQVDIFQRRQGAGDVQLTSRQHPRFWSIAVEEQTRLAASAEEAIDNFQRLVVVEEILQQRRVIVAADVEALLDLSSHPPVSFVHGAV